MSDNFIPLLSRENADGNVAVETGFDAFDHGDTDTIAVDDNGALSLAEILAITTIAKTWRKSWRLSIGNA